MAKKHTTTIEINGRRYDAVTGAVVHDPTVTTTRPIDDVRRIGRQPPAPLSKPPQPVLQKLPTMPLKPKVMDGLRPVHHAKVHQPQRGKTLMRQAVSKPRPSFKRQLKPITRTDVLAKVPKLAVAPKWSVATIDPQRLKHAERVVKSHLISKFAPLESAYASPGYAAIPVPIQASPQTIPLAQHAAVQSTAHATRSMDIFQRALTHATAHEQPPVNPKNLAKASRRSTISKRSGLHRRTVTLATTALAVVLLTGFIAYQNKANLTLRVASAAAGFHATLPGYKPSGFAIGSFKYSPGVVAVNFHNNTDNGSYSLTQKSSTWDSQTLLDSYVATKSHTYQTLQSAGRTIYIYGNNDAAWVNNGIMYQVDSNGGLTTNDLLDIANSI